MILTLIMFKCSAFCFVAEYFQLGGDSAMLADCHESEGDLLLVLSEGDSHFRRSMVMIIPNDIFPLREKEEKIILFQKTSHSPKIPPWYLTFC